MEDSPTQELWGRAELPWLALCCLSPVPAFTHGWQHGGFSQLLCWASSQGPSWSMLETLSAQLLLSFRETEVEFTGWTWCSCELSQALWWWLFFTCEFWKIECATPQHSRDRLPARNFLLVQKKRWVNMDPQGRIIDLLRPTQLVKSWGWKWLHLARVGCRGWVIFRQRRSFAARLYHWCNASRELWALPVKLSPFLTYLRK